ncbi:hypothetical protein C7B67_20845 [filamentous cyanobacterium Phorm 6]|nr:hypothetical protein C7B67_20845 [filamentous cyanobacterium Phorm 6]
MNNPIIWLHGDCLSPEGPAFQAHPEAPAIWVWDDKLIDEWQLSLKRIINKRFVVRTSVRIK